jgi:TATA box binding protein associated factor (TAF)
MTSAGHIKPSLISAIAELIGITELNDDAARVLAPDVEYRVRDILQVRALLGASADQMAPQLVQAFS